MEVRATDAVILLEGNVLLLERIYEPHEGSWVLPGGFVERNERAREACVRETREKVGLAVQPVEFVGLYDEPDRETKHEGSTPLTSTISLHWGSTTSKSSAMR
jgi:8-oxo-dGTP diphosphatase